METMPTLETGVGEGDGEGESLWVGSGESLPTTSVG
jgi:hypothetical protein